MNLESINEVRLVLSIEKKPLLIAGTENVSDRSNPESANLCQDLAWDAVERFVRQAPVLSELGDLIGQALRAVRDGIQANVVYWLSADEVHQIGDRTLPNDWCRNFTRQLLEETPGVERQLLRSHLPNVSRISYDPGHESLSERGVNTPRAPLTPTSAALVRVSRSKSTWMVALGFQPDRTFQPVDLKVMTVIKQILVQEQRRRRMTGKMSDTLFWLVHCLTATIDSQGSFWEGHSERVARMAVRVGEQMDLPSAVLSDLYFAGLLHDLGRARLDEKLLMKPGPLSPDEWAHVRQGPVLADSIMADVQPLQHLRSAVRNHHERFDGQGYPDRLMGRGIPLLARILGVADACDAMLSPRPHRPGMSPEEIDSALRAGAGAQWDPQVVDRLMACRTEVYHIGRQDKDVSLSNVVGQVVQSWSVDSSGRRAASKGAEKIGF
jgi:HD-GYP domain-containing protein (c-di-GMP phosphodiesterase class II)